MGGHILDQPLPFAEFNHIDPFLLIHHWKQALPGNQNERDLGVGPHPHRGFSPVTFVFKGEVHHRDSHGNSHIVKEGGIQWMSAGMGITHSERPSKSIAQQGGDFEFIQFWVNTPAKNKMEEPIYYGIQEDELAVIDEAGTNAFIASGSLKGVQEKVPTASSVTTARIEMSPNSKFEFEVRENENALLYCLDDGQTINLLECNTKDMVVFNETSKGKVVIESKANTRLLYLAGLPINEEVKSYGPFVMNNQTKVMQALRDAQMGKMGVLIEEFD